MKDNAMQILGYIQMVPFKIFELLIQVSEYHLYYVGVIGLNCVILQPLANIICTV